MDINTTPHTPEYSGEYGRIYVWELPVRVFHWLNALSIIILAATGLLIAHPLGIMYRSEASFQYVQGTIRFIHFAFANILVFNLLFRIYWGFVGNSFARWKGWLPFSKEKWEEIKTVIRVDILLKDEEEHVSPAHNALAAVVYLTLGVALFISIMTGFALYTDMSKSWLAAMFGWVIPFLGGDYEIRLIHHSMTWFYIIFTMIHVYLTFYHDYVEGRGVVTSIVGGWKFCRIEKMRTRRQK